MTEMVAAFVTIRGMLSFLANVSCFLYPSGGSVWFPVVSPIGNQTKPTDIIQSSNKRSLIKY